MSEPYEKLKALTRGKRVDAQGMKSFIESLRGEVPDHEIDRLVTLTPSSYLGIAPELARRVVNTDHSLSFTAPSADNRAQSADPFYLPINYCACC